MLRFLRDHWLLTALALGAVAIAIVGLDPFEGTQESTTPADMPAHEHGPAADEQGTPDEATSPERVEVPDETPSESEGAAPFEYSVF